MTDQQDNPSNTSDYQEIEYVVKEASRKKRTPLQRIGCVGLILLWLFVMMIPVFFFIMATEGDITIAHSNDVPDRHQHPRLQISLVSELDFRGFSITNSSLDRIDNVNLCIQTNVRYLLWQGEGDPASFCDCYTRPDADTAWQFEATTLGRCDQG